MQEAKRVLLLDYCSEKNRGDAAMQVGLIRLVKEYLPPNTIISILSVFGFNQQKAFQQEYDHSLTYNVRLLGGLKPTFYPLEDKKLCSEILTEGLNAIGFLPSLLLLLALRAGIPPRLAGKFMPKIVNQSLEVIAEADIVIWNGRNFRSRKNPIVEIFRTLHLVYHPLIALALHKEIACVGASVWQLNSPAAESILRSVFKQCHFISLREKQSYLQTQKLLGAAYTHQLHLLPDLSIAAFDLPETDVSPAQAINPASRPRTVGFTLVDWTSEGKLTRTTYLNAIYTSIKTLLREGSEVIIIPQVTKKWETYAKLLEEIRLGLSEAEKNRIRVINGEPNIDQLLQIYAQLDFLVATRMHSAIFATLAKTPLIAICYDQGGKWNILKDLGYGDYLLPYTHISADILLERMDHFWKNRASIMSEIQRNLSEHLCQVDLNITLLLNSLEGRQSTKTG